MYTCARRNQKTTSCIIPWALLSLQSLSVWDLQSRPGWLAIKPQGTTCLCFPVLNYKNVPLCPDFFFKYEFWSSHLGLPAYKASTLLIEFSSQPRGTLFFSLSLLLYVWSLYVYVNTYMPLHAYKGSRTAFWNWFFSSTFMLFAGSKLDKCFEQAPLLPLMKGFLGLTIALSSEDPRTDHVCLWMGVAGQRRVKMQMGSTVRSSSSQTHNPEHPT